MNMQTALHVLYPPRCLSCGVVVDSDFGLCSACWRETPFIEGLCCDTCGVPLPGQSDIAVQCDTCLALARPWDQGRAALEYRDIGRKLVLGLKHGDRHDIVRPAARWMARAARPILRDGMLIAPIPLHWLRLLKRKFNQSALLANALAKETGLDCCPDLMQRHRHTPVLDGKGLDQRFATLDAALSLHPRRRHRIAGRPVLIVDDVMTSGATLAAAADICRAGGASHIAVLVLARVAKDG